MTTSHHPHGRIGCVDLRDGQLGFALLGEELREWSVPDAVAMVNDALLFGAAAHGVLLEHPEAGWTRLLERATDLTPCVVAGVAAPPAQLLARLIAAEFAHPLDELRLIHPASWRPGQRRRIADACVAAGLPAPSSIEEPDLLLGRPGEPGDSVVLVSLEPARTIVTRATPDSLGWQTATLAELPLGSDDLDDATLSFLLNRVAPADRPLDAREAAELRAAARRARVQLAAEPAVDVEVAGLPQVRLQRADLEEALGSRLDEAFTFLPRLPADAASRVVLAGPGAGLPTLVQAVSAATGVAVQVAPVPSAERLTGPEFALAAPQPEGQPESDAPAAAASRWGRGQPRRALGRPRRLGPAGSWLLPAAAALSLAAGTLAVATDAGLRANLVDFLRQHDTASTAQAVAMVQQPGSVGAAGLDAGASRAQPASGSSAAAPAIGGRASSGGSGGSGASGTNAARTGTGTSGQNGAPAVAKAPAGNAPAGNAAAAGPAGGVPAAKPAGAAAAAPGAPAAAPAPGAPAAPGAAPQPAPAPAPAATVATTIVKPGTTTSASTTIRNPPASTGAPSATGSTSTSTSAPSTSAPPTTTPPTTQAPPSEPTGSTPPTTAPPTSEPPATTPPATEEPSTPPATETPTTPATTSESPAQPIASESAASESTGASTSSPSTGADG